MFMKGSVSMTPATAADVTGVLTILQAVWTFMLSAVGEVVTLIMANPLLLIPIGVVLCYTIIRIFKALF